MCGIFSYDKNNLQMGYYNTVYMGANGVATSSIDQSNPSIDDFNFDFGGSMDQVNTTSKGFELKREEDKSVTSGTSNYNYRAMSGLRQSPG